MKKRLKGLIPAGRELEAKRLLPYVDDDPPAHGGQWTAKDQLAHVMTWRQVAVAELEAVRKGAAGPQVSDDDDMENAKVYAHTHDKPASSLLREAAKSWDDLAGELEKASEDDLAKPRERQADEPYWRLFVNHTLTHLPEHIGYLHRDRGDEETVESVARWARDLAVETFPGERTAAVGEYNLGCFYAARGRAAEALPFLRRGIELLPALRDWAKQDRDLDPIRSNPELETLLA